MHTRTSRALILLAALAVARARGGDEARHPQAALRLHEVEAVHGGRRAADDHIFAVKVDGPRVWVGTEDGLALIDKPSGKVVKTWREKDGLPFKGGHGDRRRQEDRRRLAGPVRRRPRPALRAIASTTGTR